MSTKREWKPGDVGAVSGGYDGLVFRCLDLHNPDEAQWMTPDEGRFYGDDARVRPLVVIDPEDREQVDNLCKTLVEAMYRAGDERSAANGVYPATVAAALRSLLEPERPEEPTGLGAVVEDENGERWVRVRPSEEFGKAWAHALFEPLGYRDINAVRVLSEGVRGE